MNELLKNPIFATHAVVAVGSATLATAITYPLNSLKVLMQVGSGVNKQLTAADVLNRIKTLSGTSGADPCGLSSSLLYVQFVSMERRFLKWQLPGKRFERWTRIHPADKNILFRGLGLRMARSGLASFVGVGGYLFAIDQLLPK